MDHRVKPGGDEEGADEEKGTREVPREMVAALAIALLRRAVVAGLRGGRRIAVPGRHVALRAGRKRETERER